MLVLVIVRTYHPIKLRVLAAAPRCRNGKPAGRAFMIAFPYAFPDALPTEPMSAVRAEMGVGTQLEADGAFEFFIHESLEGL